MRTLSILALFCASSLMACAASSDAGDTDDSEDQLTSASALQRALVFDGYVYVRKGASDSEILSAVRSQTQTAFGALRTSQVGVNSRELKDVDPSTFKKTDVTVIDTTKSNDPGTAMTKVTYRYRDNAVVPKSFARRTALPIAVMGSSYQSQTDRVLTECTANDSEAREFQSSIWYVFEPSVPTCSAAMSKEQQAIDTAARSLRDPRTQVSKLEVDRLYIPVTVKLGADKTNKGQSYPEYDRLYAGGVQPGKLVIGLVNGFIDHGEHPDHTDSGFGEWIDELEGAMSDHTWKLVKTDQPLAASTKLAVGQTVTSDQIQRAGDGVIQRWLTLETTVKVSVGGAAPKDVGIQILAYFGADSDYTPHKYAIKNSDVFLYNGHSYIGYGPLDPKNFSASDFPSSYQILFIDGCVSYNYYHKDYIPLKSGGTKNLELITNGLEAPAWRSGYALGQFIKLLVDGQQHSYLDLLEAASDTDSLRVVDGEVDNKYDPQRTPITVTH